MKLTRRIVENIRYYFADKKGMSEGNNYLSSYFFPYEEHVSHPKTEQSPESTHRYDYRILGILYNVYTVESQGEYQQVTSIWNATHKKNIKKLEVLLR